MACLAIDIWLDRTLVARANGCDIRADGDHFDAEFMAWNAGVTEERHFPEVTAQVGSAYPNPLHAHQRLVAPWGVRLINFDAAKLLRFFQLNCFHQRAQRSSRLLGGKSAKCWLKRFWARTVER